MSVVTNVVLTWPLQNDESDERMLALVNAFHSARVSTSLKLVKECCQGGSKMLEHNVAVGAVNHLNLREFISHLRSLPWEEPGWVRLFVCGQEDDAFRQELI